MHAPLRERFRERWAATAGFALAFVLAALLAIPYSAMGFNQESSDISADSLQAYFVAGQGEGRRQWSAHLSTTRTPETRDVTAEQAEPTFTVEPITPLNAYLSATIRMKLEGGQGTKVIHVRGFDHVLFTRITFEDGAVVNWHTHPGPVVVSVAEGSLTITNAGECVERDYDAAQGFLDPGHGNVHNAKANGPTVVYATFFEVPANGQATIFAAEPACQGNRQPAEMSSRSIPSVSIVFLERNLYLPGDVSSPSVMDALWQSHAAQNS